MPDEKEKVIEKNQQLQPNPPEVEDELKETDLEKVSGGTGPTVSCGNAICTYC
jgi:hypothetical protein